MLAGEPLEIPLSNCNNQVGEQAGERRIGTSSIELVASLQTTYVMWLEVKSILAKTN